MEMENSLRQLDEYLKKIERNTFNLDQHDDGRVPEEQSEEEACVDIHEKSSENLTLMKSNNFKDEEKSINLPEKSSTFSRDFTPFQHNITNDSSIAFGYNVANNVLECQSSEYDSFEHEKSNETPPSNLIENVKSESLHIEESVEAASELAEIGLNEESLHKIAISGVQSSLPQTEKFEGGASSVHPVALKKSTALLEKSVSAKPLTGQVTTLLDLSSIGELKRLWAKSDKTVKKLGTLSARKPTEGFSRRARDTEKHQKVKSENRFEPEVEFERNIDKETVTNWSATLTKQCSVKLARLEGSELPENVRVNLTLPKAQTVSGNDTNVKNSSGNQKQNVVNKNSNKIKGSVKASIANSLKRISAKNKSNEVGLGPKRKRQRLSTPKTVSRYTQKIHTDDKEATVQLKSEIAKSEITGNNKSDANTEVEFDLSGYDLIADDDVDEDYVPSDDNNDDDYNPKKKKPKRENKTKSVKCKGTSISGRKKRKGTRIGRPPVLGHFECKLCDFTANEKNLVDKHHYMCHRVVITCEYCDKKFKTRNGLLIHQAYSHDAGKPFKCDHEGCPYASKNPLDLKRHKAKHETELKHVCDICGWRTKWRRNIKHHRIMKHSDERNFKCTICGFAAKRSTDLKDHMYRHTDEKPIQCLVCGFRVKTNYELRSHMLVHSNEKPFKCTFPGCSSATKTRADLTKHMRVHQTERPFQCHICSKFYKDQHSLNKHITGIHVADRRFKCDMCGKSFKNKYALNKHMYLHAGHKPHVCLVCSWRFSSRSNLEKHMVTHDTSDRPYPCPLCPHAARQPDHLLAHIGTVHGDKYAYFCELCKKPFKRYMQLKLHYERMHTEEEVQTLKSPSSVDLALLKIEMKLELEEKKAGKKKKRKGRGKSKTVGDTEVKQEHVDDEFEDVNGEENDISDIRLDENTGQIEIVKKKPLTGNQVNDNNKGTVEMKGTHDSTTEDKIKSKVGRNIAGEHLQTLSSNATDMSEVDKDEESGSIEKNTVNEIAEVDFNDGKIEMDELCSAEGQKSESEEMERKKESILIASGTVSTVALYEDFRLPLATKGFKFNYNKNGTKPMKAWFMDISLMDRETAEKHKKHRRKLGLLPPIPRGHPPKGYKRLKHFVDKRKKQLAENIKKAKFVKDLGLVCKRNASRSKRFRGKYTEFETIEGETLSVKQVQERLPKLEVPKEESSGSAKQICNKRPAKETCKSAKETCKSAKETCKSAKETCKSSKETKKASVKSESSNQTKKTKLKATKKKEPPGTKNSKNKKKAAAGAKTSKLLLSSEKKKRGRPRCVSLKIRKPKFLEVAKETARLDTSDRNSFEALENILNEFNQSSSSALKFENTEIGKKAGNQGTKTKNSLKTRFGGVNKQKTKASKKVEKEKTKPKYTKKYIPAKKPVKRKNDQCESSSHACSKKLKAAETELPSVVKSNGQHIDALSTYEETIQEQRVYPTNLHIPIKDSQLVMVYPTSVLQANNLSESNSNDGGSTFVNLEENHSNVEEGATNIERLDFKRSLNDLFTEPLIESQNNSGGNTGVISDRDLMQREYIEIVQVKMEPVTDETY